MRRERARMVHGMVETHRLVIRLEAVEKGFDSVKRIGKRKVAELVCLQCNPLEEG